MNPIDRVLTGRRFAALACGFAFVACGCEDEPSTSPEVIRAQAETSAAWAKEKADHPKSSRATGKSNNQAITGQRGTINKGG